MTAPSSFPEIACDGKEPKGSNPTHSKKGQGSDSGQKVVGENALGTH